MENWMDLGALGFWAFLAAVVGFGIWGSHKKRETEHETLRRILESGKPVDSEVVERILQSGAEDREMERDLRTGGIIMLGVAPGLLVFGWVFSVTLAAQMLPVMAAVAALVVCVALGLLVAAHFVGSRSAKSSNSIQDI